jgi:putative membrane protein
MAVKYSSKNWVFHTKLTLFIAIGLLSIYPTVFFLKNRKGKAEEVITIPTIIVWLLRFELLLLAIIPLLAGLMARGGRIFWQLKIYC